MPIATTRLSWLCVPVALAVLLLCALTPLLSAHSIDPEPEPGLTRAQLARFDPRLLKAVLTGDHAAFFDVIVELREQAVVPTAARRGSGEVVARLRSHARATQAPVVAQLAALQAAGHVLRVRSFWIFNGLALRADGTALLALAAREDIAQIRADRPIALAPAWRLDTAAPQAAPDAPWNLDAIRADLARSVFGVDGRGVVVANLSSGVDWTHPALQRQYRGYDPGGNHHHIGNWADVTSTGYPVPTDDLGAGTHTMGTLVGTGVGVAPGASWIAVKVFDRSGFALEEWLHAGFEWILAPAGDPALAPDIAVVGWSLGDPGVDVFRGDLAALRAAGIFAVCGTGDNGPGAGTVGAPGSYPESFTAGAFDPQDEVANFSGRGPTPWGEIRPNIVAPGVFISSTLPGGRYGSVSSSPTAPPHVAGIAALLLQAEPGLDIDTLAGIVTATARPSGPSWPNNDYGWGRVDAYAALASVRDHGTLAGTVAGSSGAPLLGAEVRAVYEGGDMWGGTTTDPRGEYHLWLAPGDYSVAAGAFGYVTRSETIAVAAGVTGTLSFSLDPVPTGRVAGRITESGSEAPVEATVSVAGTPATVTAGPDGAYALDLPAGAYTLTVRHLGYRAADSAVTIVVGEVLTQNFALEATPKILFVDTSAWYYGTEAAYFRAALDALGYVYTEKPVKILPRDTPTTSQLAPYDLVIWSSPFDSPGFVGAGDAISRYLSLGGKLFLTGQDVGYWDGGLNGMWAEPYYRDVLRARVLQDDVITRTVTAIPGEVLDGITLTLGGPDSAQNQFFPDIVLALDRDMGAPIATYTDFGGAALRGNTCVPFRSLYLAFGFEGVTGADVRLEVMRRALDWLSLDEPARGVELRPGWEPLVGVPGTVATRTVRVRNIGEAHDQYALSVTGADWATALTTSSLELDRCAAATTDMRVAIPPGAGWDARDDAQLVAAALNGPTTSLTLTTKAPAPVLYVDADRFYEGDRAFRGAFGAAGVPYDYWLVGWNYDGGRGSPPAEMLPWYPIVVWTTGYDWYAPVPPADERSLEEYLAGGGRLLLSSQDYLGVRGVAAFARERLGVLSFSESISVTQARAAEDGPFGAGAALAPPYALYFPYFNWSDALVPYTWARTAFYSERGYPAAIAASRSGAKSLFYAFPFETFREPGRGPVMGDSLGWLSALGESDIRADRADVRGGDVVTYTLFAHNDGATALRAVSAVNALPDRLSFVPGSLVGPGQYDPIARQVTWAGALAPGETVTISYRAQVGSGSGLPETIRNPLRLADEQWVPVEREAVVRVDAPDLRASAIDAAPGRVQPGTRLTVTLSLLNTGLVSAPSTLVTVTVPVSLTVVPGSLWASSGTATYTRDGIAWRGDVTLTAPVTVRWAVQAPQEDLLQASYAIQALIDDRTGAVNARAAQVLTGPYTLLAPVAAR